MKSSCWLIEFISSQVCYSCVTITGGVTCSIRLKLWFALIFVVFATLSMTLPVGSLRRTAMPTSRIAWLGSFRLHGMSYKTMLASRGSDAVGVYLAGSPRTGLFFSAKSRYSPGGMNTNMRLFCSGTTAVNNLKSIPNTMNSPFSSANSNNISNQNNLNNSDVDLELLCAPTSNSCSKDIPPHPSTNPKRKQKQPKPTLPPSDIKSYVAISFYQFHPLTQEEIHSLIPFAKQQIAALSTDIKGTLLLATEGINAAFCLPTDMLSTFQTCLQTLHPTLFQGVEFNVGQRLQIAVDDPLFPFKKLKIREKRVVLTDKIGDTLNWHDAGPELSPQAWHDEIRQRLLNKQSPASISEDTNTSSLTEQDIEAMKLPPLLLDCRNDYESNIGTFAKAIPLNTTSFSETWDALEDMLRGENPHRRVLTFCTGGIRCVKVNAFLKQKMGFHNIGRLRHGIIAYEAWLQSQCKDEEGDEKAENSYSKENLFEGQNFLFDRRRLFKDKAKEEAMRKSQQQS